MSLRDKNTRFGLIAMDLLYAHIIVSSIAFFTKKQDFIPFKIFALFVGVLILVHAIVGIIVLSKNDNKKITYASLNKATIFQRISAIWMTILAIPHAALYITFMGGIFTNKIVLVAFSAVYYLICLTHIVLSFPRAMLSAGKINDENDVKKYTKIELVKATIAFALAISSLIYYVVGK